MAPGPTHKHGFGTIRVDLGPLAGRDPLALEIKRRALGHQAGSLGERALARMWGTVVVVRRNPPAASVTLRELTLRFDYGRLVVHDGRVGRPDISLWGSDVELLSLGDALGPDRPTEEDVSAWAAPRRWWAIGRVISGVSEGSTSTPRLQIFGGLAHPRLLYRLALVLAAPVQPVEPSPS